MFVWCGRRATRATFLSANLSDTMSRVFLVALPVSARTFTCDGIIALRSPILAKQTLKSSPQVLHSALHQPQVLRACPYMMVQVTCSCNGYLQV